MTYIKGELPYTDLVTRFEKEISELGFREMYPGVTRTLRVHDSSNETSAPNPDGEMFTRATGRKRIPLKIAVHDLVIEAAKSGIPLEEALPERRTLSTIVAKYRGYEPHQTLEDSMPEDEDKAA